MSEELQAKAPVCRARCTGLQRPATRSPVGPGTTAGLNREETTAHLGRASHHLGKRRGQQAVPSSKFLKLGTRPLAYTWKGQSLCWVATRGSCPAHPWWETAYFRGQPSLPVACKSLGEGVTLILTTFPQNGKEWNSLRAF